jgi:transcription-repair coupling factor (superfamily II helicase)
VPSLFQRFEQDETFQRLVNAVRANRRVVNVAGLANGAKALAIAALQKVTGKRLAVVSLRNKDLEDLEADVCFFYQTLNDRTECVNEVYVLPSSEHDPYSGTSPHADVLERRALALWRLTEGKGDIVLLTAHALMRRYEAVKDIQQASVTLRVGEELSFETILQHLVAVGYKRADPVSAIGEFSSRGGILDFYPPASSSEQAVLPVRVEFFGDEVDAIREFDPETQRSTRELEETVIVPMRDERAGTDDFKLWAEAAREHWRDDRYERTLRDRTVFADEGEEFQGWEYLMPLLRPLTANLFDYLRDATLVIDEPAEVEKQLRSLLEELQRGYDRCEQIDELALPPDQLFLTPDELRALIDKQQRVELRLLGAMAMVQQDELTTEEILSDTAIKTAANPRLAAFVNRPPSAPLFLFPPEAAPREFNLTARAVRRWHGKVADLATELKELAACHQRTIFVLPSTGVADRIRKTLNEIADFRLQIADSDSDQSALSNLNSAIHFVVGDLSVGFALPDCKLSVYTEADIFDEAVHAERVQRNQTKGKRKLGAFLSDFRDLKIGDYVVHVDHGIGQFQGLFQIDVSGPETSADIYARMVGGAEQKADKLREFMLLTYADGQKLYVPVERLDLVQKFAGGEMSSPSLDKLGGIAWAKTKARVKRAMRDMAEELLKLYAERKLVKGYSFSGDTPWQQEFEDAFPYELTPDQATAVNDVKADMEEAEPMDRLLCGDVGYGKTEVAMRAAFKAVMDGKQVAVLAPTTVLSYQHFQNFKARFAAFPARIELLSRFRSQKEQKQVVEGVEKGQVDVVIGTHRVLSRDLNFKDLGLVVVDEEQRFGVAHKERLKHIKKRVDVLTMSATPIPRTLNMSLLGLRDMSVIETPPRDRLAIQTNVVAFNDAIIRSAIELELQRQGQVFFVHNRVESIEEIAGLLKRIAPEARYVVAHGQMGEKEMEQAVLDFVDYKYDVLVATTIIENGIDIPRANTIIINRADHYGLSQLYQLRGRVGRSSRRAYAYLLIPSEQELTPIARKRLAAIREFSDLGAGFRIAALDLELRGAGNLLGGQQSGQIEAVGFDLYAQMLERTVMELRGEPIEEEINTQMNLGVDTRIPEEYVFDMSQRLRSYKRIASAKTDDELQRIRAEMADRYGRLPESVENLFAYASVRREAEQFGFVSIDRTGETLAIKISERTKIEAERLLKYLASHPTASFSPSGILRLKFQASEQDLAARVFETLRAFMQALK